MKMMRARPSSCDVVVCVGIEVRTNGSDQRSINSKGGKNGKSTNSETANSSVSQQLQEISAKLQKLDDPRDDLEKLSKELLGKLPQLAHRVDVVSAENRLLKWEIEELWQDRLQEEVLIKGIKLERPKQHLEVFRGVCERAGFHASDDVKEIEVRTNGSDQRSINSKGGKNGKSTNSETANSSVSQQLQEISAKLQKQDDPRDDLEKLSKELLGKLPQLAHRVDVVSAENRLLKWEIEELWQDRLQE
ncbi:hypothetical protein quinque_001543 [Culex quinquefasciatus]